MLSSIFNWSVVAILASFTLMPASTGRTTAPTVEPIVEEMVDYYWFEINGNFEPDEEINPADANFLNYGPAPIGGTVCNGSNHLCIGGFSSSQVVQTSPGNFILDDQQIAMDQTRLKN